MHPATQDIATTLDLVESHILQAGALLQTTAPEQMDKETSTLDRALRSAYEAADATARFLTLLRDPLPKTYAPVELIRNISAHHPAAATRKDTVEAMRQCRGDEEQVAETVRLLVENVQLTEDTGMQCEVTMSEGAPRLVFTLQPPDDFPDTLRMGASYTFSLEDLGHRWTAASAGGHIAQTPQVLILFLEGQRDIPLAHVTFNRAAPHAKKLARSLRAWRGAIGHYEPGYGSGQDIITLYQEALAPAANHLHTLRQALSLRP